jgi:hypothetical protein
MFGNDTGRSDEYILECAARYITHQLEALLRPLKFDSEAREVLQEYYGNSARIFTDERIPMHNLFLSFGSVISKGETKEIIEEYQPELIDSIRPYILPILVRRYINIHGVNDDQPDI